MSTSAGSRVPYIVFVGAEVIDPIAIQHVRAQWAFVVSWLACSTGSEKAARLSRSIEHILNGLKNICKFWSLIKTYDLLMCNIIKVVLYNGYSQMLRISLKTEKYFIAHPSCLQSVVGLECFHLGLFSRYSTARSGTVTWWEWGLWFELTHGSACNTGWWSGLSDSLISAYIAQFIGCVIDRIHYGLKVVFCFRHFTAIIIIQYPCPEPVYTGCPVYTGIPLECHWLTPVYTGISLGDTANACRVHWNTTRKTLLKLSHTGMPLEKLWLLQPTLEHHWRDCSSPHI